MIRFLGWLFLTVFCGWLIQEAERTIITVGVVLGLTLGVFGLLVFFALRWAGVW